MAQSVDGSRRSVNEGMEGSFDTIITEGQEQLGRSWTDLLATGMIAGIDVAFGVLALLSVEKATGSTLLGGLAFSVGFIALLLGHSGLFTEGFFVPVMVVAAGEAKVRHLVKYWVGTIVSNLAGGALVAWIIDEAFPSLHSQAIISASYYIQSGINIRSFCLAILAGGAITLLTRMQTAGTSSDVAKLIAAIASAFLLAGVGLFHSILDSLLAFTALDTGRAPFGYLDWLGWLGFIIVGNMVGGLGLTSFLRLLRNRQRLLDHRAMVARNRSVA